MDVLAALLACSLYPADDALVRAIADSNGHRNPYFVYDPTLDMSQGDPPPDPHSLSDALARAAAVDAKQATPLLGILELPPAWLTAFGRSRADAFDACINVAIGTAWLSAFASDCAHEMHRRSARWRARLAVELRGCVLERYASALHMPDLPVIVGLELRFQKPVTPALYDAPIFPSSEAPAWGPNRILVGLDSLRLSRVVASPESPFD